MSVYLILRVVRRAVLFLGICQLPMATVVAAQTPSEEFARVTLKPAVDNEVEFDIIDAKIYADGSKKVEMVLTLEPGESERFSYEIDFDRREYRTLKLEDDGTEIIPLSPPGGCNDFVYRATGQIIHFDGVLIPLTQTGNSTTWIYDKGSGCVFESTFIPFCWANPETNPPVLPPTHWFVQYCNSSLGTIGETIIWSHVTGGYNNWDFGFPNLETWVIHDIQIDIERRFATFSLADFDGGEGSGIIFGIGETSVTYLGCE